MQALHFPAYPIKLKTVNQQTQIFDEVRKKWLKWTPEEWVRQHMIHFLHQEYDYPLSLMAVEKKINFNTMDRRPDLVCFNTNSSPVLIAECKAPEIKLDQKTLDQIARYNMVLQVPALFITNGIQHYCLVLNDQKQYEYVNSVPHFSNL